MDGETLQDILLAHAKRYPQMRQTDAVKLIYQNEFGGGHLIRDEEAVLKYLRQEYESVEKNASMPLYEDIGNGIVRVNLAAVRETDLEKLGQAFIRSAAEHKGSLDSFKGKLAVLSEMTERAALVRRSSNPTGLNTRKPVSRQYPTARNTVRPTSLPTES